MRKTPRKGFSLSLAFPFGNPCCVAVRQAQQVEWRAAPREDKKPSAKKIFPIAAKAIGKIVAPYRAAAVLAALRFVSGAFSALFQFIQLRLLSFQQMLRP